MSRIDDRLAVEGDDDVAALEAGLKRWRSALEIVDECPAGSPDTQLLSDLSRERIEHHAAKRAAPHDTMLDDIADDPPGEIARDREPDTFGAAVAPGAENASVDADQLAARAHEGAARVAAIDRGIGLNEVFVF